MDSDNKKNSQVKLKHKSGPVKQKEFEILLNNIETELQIIGEMVKLIQSNNCERDLHKLVKYINKTCKEESTGYILNNPFNLIILPCKYNKLKILEFLLNGSVLNKLCDRIGVTCNLIPSNVKDLCHNVFYYAIRTSNSKMLSTLINKWPGNYFSDHLEELDKLLSSTYEELKLKNILLSDEIQVFVESKLIELRTVSYSYESENIKDRIELMSDLIKSLEEDYSSTEKVDEKFLYITKCIALNVHTLKRFLKSTYDKIPWEEIEFCLISFVCSYVKKEEINLCYYAILNKNKILTYLKQFSELLNEHIDDRISKNVSSYPRSRRNEIVSNIIQNHPHLEQLYNDYQQIRDYHSLYKINCFIKLAISANVNLKEGQLTIKRVLALVGEYLKNTIESPHLSDTAAELLLLSLPKNTRMVITKLRNSLTHALPSQMEIEGDACTAYFTGIQNDIGNIANVVSSMLFENNNKIVKLIFHRILECNTVQEVCEIFKTLTNIKIEKLINIQTKEHMKIKKLVKALSDKISVNTDSVKALFKKIDEIITGPNEDINMGMVFLECINRRMLHFIVTESDLKVLKFTATTVLKEISEKQLNVSSIKEVVKLIIQILREVTCKINDNYDEVHRLVTSIFYVAQYESDDIKWLEKLKRKMKRKFISNTTGFKTDIKNQDTILLQKLDDLKYMSRCEPLNENLIENYSLIKNNKTLITAIEMTVLDIMTILDYSKNNNKHYLGNNKYFLDDYTPVLIGKTLRNHLAHNNIITNILSSDPSFAVIVTSKKFIAECTLKNSNPETVFKLKGDNILELKAKYKKDIFNIGNQERMFTALEEGDLETFAFCIANGADINGRDILSRNALQFAAKGPSLEIVKFLINQSINVTEKLADGQSILHTAAKNGRENLVEFFIKEKGFKVDITDNNRTTPLHFAALYGHLATVKVLLKYKANIRIRDIPGCAPLHYAVRNNHIKVSEILLEEDVNVDINEMSGGYTSLHGAAERGCLEIVNFLLENGADFNAKNENLYTPLHAAAFYGYLDIVNALILKGADVNGQTSGGCTPLHFAIENGHEDVAKVLLSHRADPNIVDINFKNTPLHYAARFGYLETVKKLLENNAHPNCINFNGTPLHGAVLCDNILIVDVLLNNFADINARDENRRTPLHLAVFNGNREIVQLLVHNRAEVNAKDINNVTPLHVAAENGFKDITELLVLNKANVNSQDKIGRTPLLAAAQSGSKEIIEYLLENNANLEINANTGTTALHLSASNGHYEALQYLIELTDGANINKNVLGLTPLHSAIEKGHKDVVNLLIKHKADVNAKNFLSSTPLHMAAFAGHEEIVKILLTNGAKINDHCDGVTPLFNAVSGNFLRIVELLIKNGANVNEKGDGNPLLIAILNGFKDIAEILLKNNAEVNIKDSEDFTPLHLATRRDYVEMVEMLLKMGADVHAEFNDGITALHVAALENNEDVAEMLIANGVDIHFKTKYDETPLHVASEKGNNLVVKILLDNGANVEIRNKENKTVFDIATAKGHLETINLLLENREIEVKKFISNNNCTLLHIASQNNNLEMVKYLVGKGCDVNAKNVSGLKPIHIATREGNKEIVEFFLNKGLSVNETDSMNQTLLHYAAQKCKKDVILTLIEKGADVNFQDINGQTPMHIAARLGYKDIIEVLLKSNAIVNIVDKNNMTPLELGTNKDALVLLTATNRLLQVAMQNKYTEINNYIRAGGVVNAHFLQFGTLLHYAAQQGYDNVVSVLLQNKANPNIADYRKLTALHFAVKHSHIKIVKALLAHGAIYNVISSDNKKPVDFSKSKNITNLFQLINETFKNIKTGSSKVINDFNKIKDIETLKAIMGTRNGENQTIVAAATLSDFPKLKQLINIGQSEDISSSVDLAASLVSRGETQEALQIFKNAFEKRKEILGPDNPATLEAQLLISKAYYANGAYTESLRMVDKIFHKQKEVLGLNAKSTLYTRSYLALLLHRLGRDEEAFSVYQEVYPKQKELLGLNHHDILDTQLHMALVLDRLGKYDEALSLNRDVYEKNKKLLGINHPSTVSALNNVAMVLASQENYEEALNIYREVLTRKKMILGPFHLSTLNTYHSIAGVLLNMHKYQEAMEGFQEVLDIQKKHLGPNHPNTLNTQYSIGNACFNEGKFITAYKLFNDCINQRKMVFGPDHSSIIDIQIKLEAIKMKHKFVQCTEREIMLLFQQGIITAATKGDYPTIRRLISEGADVNSKDFSGRTPLHYAVHGNNKNIVKLLLKNGADITLISNKGNTPLHTASLNGFKEMVEILLKHLNNDKRLNDFLNARTTLTQTTSLHIASKCGFYSIVKILLEHGTIYNFENKDGKKPADVSNHVQVVDLLKLIEDLFENAESGNTNVIVKLERANVNIFKAITNARNKEGNTLSQVAIINKHKSIAMKLLQIIKLSNV